MHRDGVCSCATFQVHGDVTNQFKVLLELINVCEHVKRAFRLWIV